MGSQILNRIAQWQAAGLVDAATAERIRAWESEHAPARSTRLGQIAFALGGVLLGAGVLLFVAANWALLAPSARFAALAATVAVLHVAGGLVRSRSVALSTTLHAVGTAALGGGIFLAGQSFNLAEQWPAGFLLWAIGAAVGLLILRDWPHVLWVAVLAPLWLCAEWEAAEFVVPWFRGGHALPAVGLFVLGAAYLASVGDGRDATWRRALSRVGAVLLLVSAAVLPFVDPGAPQLPPALEAQRAVAPPPQSWLVLGWSVAILLPLLAGWLLRGVAAWPLIVAIAFAVAAVLLGTTTTAQRLAMHLLYLAGAAGLVWWGIRDSHRLRVNVGVIGFALVVLSFYFSSVFDKLGRALGMIGLGVLFLVGGWLLERARRRLIGRIAGDSL